MRGERPGDAKVGQLQGGPAQEQVGRLEVPVDQALGARSKGFVINHPHAQATELEGHYSWVASGWTANTLERWQVEALCA